MQLSAGTRFGERSRRRGVVYLSVGGAATRPSADRDHAPRIPPEVHLVDERLSSSRTQKADTALEGVSFVCFLAL
jgi:hypothetical protein